MGTGEFGLGWLSLAVFHCVVSHFIFLDVSLVKLEDLIHPIVQLKGSSL